MNIKHISKNKPLVTVVTVTYNAEKFLEQTIKSVIEQDYPNIEYIIIDGGSSDGTVDIIKRYEKHINYWVSEKDEGIYDAMNKGIDKATGEWINFMNAGDSFVHSGTISEVISNVTDDIDLIVGDINYIENDKATYRQHDGLDYALDHMFCCHQALFTRMNIMKKYKFSLDFKFSADYDFVLKCHMNDYKFKFVDFAIANFISDGMSETNIIHVKIENMCIQSKYLKNSEDIYSLNSYNTLKSLERSNNNNALFTRLLNNFYKRLDEMTWVNKKVVLYGYGNIGKLIYEKYSNYITDVIDRNAIRLNEKEDIVIHNIEDIRNIEFDYIVITVLGKEKEISTDLIEKYKIDNSKIITIEV